MTLIYKNTRNIIQLCINHQYQFLLVQVTDGTNTILLYRENEKQTFHKVLTTSFKETLSPLFFDLKKANIIYTLSNIGRDQKSTNPL